MASQGIYGPGGVGGKVLEVGGGGLGRVGVAGNVCVCSVEFVFGGRRRRGRALSMGFWIDSEGSGMGAWSLSVSVVGWERE